ncbi:MAG: electron transfer flavoprotein subunit beta/FixA family protein [Anaerolineales bacterium]|nr:electron transfer flavoprotein subunit beta/FixA family protein [Anaerolineales bacterium]
MKIVVCVKQTVDTAAEIAVEQGVITWGDIPLVLNPWDEFAVEEGLRLREAQGGSVTALTVGAESAQDALRSALAMGADDAVWISDSGLEMADSLAISTVLATAINKLDKVDLVLFGREAVDSNAGVLNAQVARRLGWPSLALTAAIPALDPAGKSIEVERMLDRGRQRVRSSLPAVVSVVKEINEPRYASFMGIRKAARVEIPRWSLEDLGIDSIQPGVTWLETSAAPQSNVACEFIEAVDETAAAQALVARLREEKVI